MKGVAIGAGVVGVGLLAFGIAWIAGRDRTQNQEPPRGSGDVASDAIPDRPAGSDVQAGFRFGEALVREFGNTTRTIYQGEMNRDAQRQAEALARQGALPGGVSK